VFFLQKYKNQGIFKPTFVFDCKIRKSKQKFEIFDEKSFYFGSKKAQGRIISSKEIPPC
jgi:hypothetical protein